jgi:hypothetical protein
MKQDEFFKIIGIVIVSFFIIYMTIKMFQIQTRVIEGLTNNDPLTSATGEAGTATSYAEAIKAQVVKLQDELLVAKYRKDYETAIINLNDYVGYLMIQQTLNMTINGDLKTNIDLLNNLNVMNTAKVSLNATMTFLDQQ